MSASSTSESALAGRLPAALFDKSLDAGPELAGEGEVAAGAVALEAARIVDDHSVDAAPGEGRACIGHAAADVVSIVGEVHQHDLRPGFQRLDHVLPVGARARGVTHLRHLAMV